MITDDELKRVMPNCPAARRADYLPFIQQAMQEFSITSYLREAAFLAQLAHESGELRYMEEIASGQAYEGRKDLGNTQAGDGKRYKGRGPIQLTGRSNYKRYGDLLGLDLINNPTIAATKEVGFRIAGQFWSLNGLNELADQQKFESITRRINGGLNGQADRLKYYALAKKVLSKEDGEDGETITIPVPPPVEATNPGQSLPYPGILQSGSRGPSVTALQRRLCELGAGIDADGVFGNGTRQAVASFQSTNSLTSDGIVGPSTWAALWKTAQAQAEGQ